MRIDRLLFVTYVDRQMYDLLGHIIRRLGRLSPFLEVAGQYFLGRVEEAFAAEAGPDSAPWHPLNKEYEDRKKGPSILTESGTLRGSYRYEVLGPNRLAVGPDRSIPYHRIHQKGGTAGGGAKIPARPQVGATGRDAEHLGTLMLAHIRGLTDTR